jgi:hypothetical protein
MISKENFVKYINKLKELNEIESNINEAAKGIEFFDISFIEHESLIVNILEDAFNDESKWISYFIYDLDFGSTWHKNCITFEGKDTPMRNAEELYDVLINQ